MGGGLLSATLGGFSSLSWVGCHLGAVFVTLLGSGSALGKCKPLGRTQPGPVLALAIKPWGASVDDPHHNPPLSQGCWWTGGAFGCMGWVRGTPGWQRNPCSEWAVLGWGAMFWDHSSCSPVRLVLQGHDGSFQVVLSPCCSWNIVKKIMR